MTALTEESLEQALMKLAGMVEDVEKKISLRPSHLIVPPSLMKQAYKIMYYKRPIRRVSGARKRKRALYWR